MGKIREKMKKPTAQEIEEAKQMPNGWVYRISGKYLLTESIPPEKIEGAWQVDHTGKIIGDFIPNENFKAE